MTGQSNAASTTKPPELWERVDDGSGLYRWMVWIPGPIGIENGRWFETREEAEACIELLTQTATA